MKRTTAFLLLLVLLFSLSSCKSQKDQIFTQSEFSITLTEEYNLTPNAACFVSYETKNQKAVQVIKDRKFIVEDIAGKTNVSLTEYAALVIATNQHQKEAVSQNGIVCYTYTVWNSGVEYTHLATVHESKEAFWLVTFVCPTQEFSKNEAEFFRFAQSVSIKEN